ncbi:hypothetical protein JSR02_00500 [Candidatus Vidania fulgoroideae]|uniref:Uncharacterized protein n=1 Tax=Candidatus Vidania fulgoroideorum TaxID=881286 RepID=A0A974X706_9PROT|nr:hypothetical protein JSR02_00500 [Candidatus Vidania fulgoroideae]
MNSLIKILVANDYHYLHTFFCGKGFTVPHEAVSYIRFIACIIPAFLKILFYLKRNIGLKMLVFMDGGCGNYANFKSLLRSKLVISDTYFNEAVLKYSLLKHVKLFIVLSETLNAAFLKSALKRQLKVIYITNSFKPLLYKPFLFLRCNVASYRMRVHFLKQVYYLRRFAFFANEFFDLKNVKYFLYSLSSNSVFIVSLLFKEFLYYNRLYITYSINKLFRANGALNIFVIRLVMCRLLRKFYRIYNERIVLRFCKRFVFPLFQVRFYCHNGMYACFCIYRACSVNLIDRILMHFIAYKDLIGPKFLDLPFIFNTCKPVSNYVLNNKCLRVFFLK